MNEDSAEEHPMWTDLTLSELQKDPEVVAMELKGFQTPEFESWNATQRDEFLNTLWNVIVCLIDVGYGVHPAQQALRLRGKSA